MTVTKKPARKTAEEFIAAAPDAGRGGKPARRRVIRGHKEQLTLTIAPDTVDRVDAAAAKLGLSRTAWITLAINLQLAAAGG
ncbi:CopG family transcriptional regulator [Roseateles sp.]|uniref:CopG family transcriptional regulator n=1 Tax=Roseateles sp. TaxID=1971397 RepID=UPI0031D94EA8